MNIVKRLLPLIAATCVLFAQTDRGSIEGTVKDPNGAVVPGAKVQVVNIETNSTLDFESNEVGRYLAPALPVGSYRLVVQKEGFKTVVREPILVSAQSNLAVEIALQIGALADTVTVTAESPLLDVSATANPTNLSADFIEDLPMIIFGQKRNITDNLRFLPGNTSTNGNLSSGEQAESWSGRVNSAVQGATEIFVDGAPSSEFGTRRGSVLENGPIVEAVAEYTVVANAFNAEFGGHGSWFTTVTLKSGTNTLHGKVYDYFGNDKLNARNFFQGSVKQKLRQNEAGFQFGGPVIIPKVYDGRNKTFLFFSQGLYYARLGGSGGLQTVPRTDFKSGNFANFVDAAGVQIPIFDPQTTRPDGAGNFVRTQFPGNIIPANRISPISSKIVSLMPNSDLPSQTNNWYNRTGAFPYFNTFTSIAKLDHSISTSQKIALTYQNQWRPRLINSNGWGSFANVVPGLPEAPDVLEGFQLQTVTSQTWRVNHDYIFSPRLLNHLTLGVDRYVNPYTNTTVGQGWNQALGITGLPEDLGAFPRITFGGGTGSPLALGLPSNGLGAQTRYSINENLTFIKGNHTFKFGFYHWRYATNSRNQSNTAGTFSFSNQLTSQPNSPRLVNWGSSFASFLLGEVSTAGTTLQNTTGFRMYSYALFAQDDWRVTSKLTLSYGLRWDNAPPLHEVHDQLSSFSPTAPNPVGVPGALVFGGSGTGRIGEQFYKPWRLGFSPRLGMAYAWNSKTILRASGGIYYSDQSVGGTYTAGFTASPSFPGANAFTSAYNWTTGSFPQNFIRPPQILPEFQNNQNITWSLPDAMRLPQVMSWTVGIQRQLAADLALDVSYIGSHSTHLSQNTIFNFVDQKHLSLGNLLLQTAGSPGAAAANVPVPFPGFTSYSRNTVAQALMPFPQYGSVNFGNDPVGSARFNSLQVKTTKRFSNGFMLMAFWTWMKNMATSGNNQYTPNKPMLYSGDSPPHTFVINASYDLPFGPKQRLLGSAHPVVGAIVGGWNLSGYARYTSGSAYGFGGGNNLSTLGYGGKTANYVAGVPIFGETNPRNFNPAVSRYFAPAGAFVIPALYEFGNTAPTLDWVRGFTQKAESVSLGKAFPIKERLKGQFRIDVNNPFNFVRWNNPNGTFTSADYGRVTGSAEGRRVQLYLGVDF
jgi:hypothetical protein